MTAVKLILKENSLKNIYKLEETGMDFWIINGKPELNIHSDIFVVRSNGIVVPIKSEEYYSIESMSKGISLPEESKEIEIDDSVSLSKKSEVIEKINVFLSTVPTGYTRSIGAHQLLGKITLSYPAKFYRYTSKKTDPKYSNGKIKSDTYLTTQSDQQYVNTGYGAVGRYSLLLPVPASYKHMYTIPKGTKMKVGTVAPNYGQSGGGVEVKTIRKIPNVKYEKTVRLDDC
jgi:hypothetical protein